MAKDFIQLPDKYNSITVKFDKKFQLKPSNLFQNFMKSLKSLISVLLFTLALSFAAIASLFYFVPKEFNYFSYLVYQSIDYILYKKTSPVQQQFEYTPLRRVTVLTVTLKPKLSIFLKFLQNNFSLIIIEFILIVAISALIVVYKIKF